MKVASKALFFDSFNQLQVIDLGCRLEKKIIVLPTIDGNFSIRRKALFIKKLI